MAETTARTLVDTIIVRYGCPLSIISDRGAGYESALFKELCRILGILKLRTTPYNPRSNPVERWHRSMNSMLAKCVKTNQKDWDDVIGLVAAAYRSSTHETIKHSPNEIIFGKENRMAIDLMYGTAPSETDLTPSEYIRKIRNSMEKSYALVRNHLQTAAKRRADKYFPTVKACTFEPGQKVWYYRPRRKTGQVAKWNLCYSGPYSIISQKSLVTYEIAPLAGRRPFVVHIDKLKRCGEGEEREEETEEPDAEVEEREEEGMNEPSEPDPNGRPKRIVQRPRRFQH